MMTELSQANIARRERRKRLAFLALTHLGVFIVMCAVSAASVASLILLPAPWEGEATLAARIVRTLMVPFQGVILGVMVVPFVSIFLVLPYGFALALAYAIGVRAWWGYALLGAFVAFLSGLALGSGPMIGRLDWTAAMFVVAGVPAGLVQFWLMRRLDLLPRPWAERRGGGASEAS